MLIECFDGKAHNHCLDDSSGPIVIGNKSFLLFLRKQEPDRQQAYETKVGIHPYRYQTCISISWIAAKNGVSVSVEEHEYWYR